MQFNRLRLKFKMLFNHLMLTKSFPLIMTTVYGTSVYPFYEAVASLQ